MSDIVYFCDPVLNQECRKTGCFLKGGPCQATKDAKFAMKNYKGLPIKLMEEGFHYDTVAAAEKLERREDVTR